MPKRYQVRLTPEQRRHLRTLIRKGTSSARTIARAHMLLLAEEGRTDQAIAAALHVGRATLERVRKRYVEEGLEAALRERARAGRPRTLGPDAERYVRLVCSFSWWEEGRPSARELAQQVIELGMVGSVSAETVRRLLRTRGVGKDGSGCTRTADT